MALPDGQHVARVVGVAEAVAGVLTPANASIEKITSA